MKKHMSWMVLAMMVACGVAQAKKPVLADRWEAVEALTPGEEINVRSESQAGSDLCLVSAVDEQTLTCLAERAAGDVRLVFPRSAVRSVWVMELAPNRHIGLWIGLAVSAALEITACVAGGAAGGLVVGMFVAAAWLAAETPSPWAIWYPPPPRPQRWRRRIIYNAPLLVAAP